MGRTIILDADGVLCNFVDAACRVHGRDHYAVTSWNFFEDWGITAEEFWSPIRALGTNFYRDWVEPYPWTDELLELSRTCGDVIIASVAGADTPEDYAGKVAWVQHHIGDVPVFMTPAGGTDGYKHMLASPGRVLIDDSDRNVGAFRGAGGNAIVFPQPWNRCHSLADCRMQFVKDCLGIVKGGCAA